MESAAPDHYAMLGLDRRCTVEQVRAAYRVLSKRHHPDLNPGSPEAVTRAQELNAAYEILSDTDRRRAYDRDLSAKSASAAASTRRSGKTERNISQDVHLRLEEFFRGASLEVRVNDPANPNGEETYSVRIPSNTAPEVRLKVARSAPFEGGFVQIRLRLLPHFRFKARGSDLRCDLRINGRRAREGGTETLTGPTGTPLRVEIPRGVGRGELLRVSDEGLPKPRGGRGDLLVRITYRPEVRISRKSA